MADIGVKLSFSRSQMIFNVDLEANLGEYFSKHYLRSRQPPVLAVPVKDNVNENRQEEKKYDSIVNYLGGSFTFASIMEDFVSGSRINFNYSALSWSKFLLFTGKEYPPFFPNLNPSFSKIAALEYTPEQEVSAECVSFSIRRRVTNMFSLVTSAAWITPRGPCWTVGVVAEDRNIGLESIIAYNYKGDYCVGMKKEIGDSGLSLRLAAVVKGGDGSNFKLRDCFEIGLEM